MPRNAARVLVLGSSNTDLVVTCSRLPIPGETVLGGEFQKLPGGKGANQAVAAARAGAKVIFLGARGDDDFGRAAEKALKQEGIDLAGFRCIKSAPSGVALILLGGKSRENVIAVAKSANDLVSPKDVLANRGKFRTASSVLAQLEVPLPAVEAAADLAVEEGIPFLLNPAPARKLPQALLRKVHVLLPNEHEALEISGKRDVAAAAKELLRMGCRNVVVTLGAKGALHAWNGCSKIYPAPKVKAVDTVGAGDCFCGWFATGLAEGLALGESIGRALKAASLSVTRAGAQAAMPQRREV